MILLQTLSAPTLVKEDLITVLNFLYKDVFVDFIKYCVAASLFSIKILVASEIVILVLASTKIGVASITTLLSAVCNALMTAYAKLCKSTSLNAFSTFCNSLGKPIFTNELL